uniref:NADH-ubiquinone oxidoreductase chain 2 n=1 Tax=Physa fontinalis TaxID=146087 RepID=A0A7D7ACQ8_9GAST|nr:NADH dehydrogenase subunit 2 [Physa fontinalis]
MYMYLMSTTSLILFGQFFSLTTSSWVMSWLGMEMSLLGLLPLMLEKFKVKLLASEVTMKYFIIQSLSSMWLMLGGFFLWEMNNYEDLFFWLFIGGVVLKLGLFPGHFWVVQVINGLKIIPLFYVLTLVKVAPLFLISNILSNMSGYSSNLMYMLGTSSIMVGSLIGFIQSTLRGVIGGSSIAHNGWMIISMQFSVLTLYYVAYLLSFLVFVWSFMSSEKMSVVLPILSFSGLPPFLLFAPKMLIFYGMMISNMYIMLMTIIFFSVVSLFIYLKISFSYYLVKQIHIPNI